MKFIYLLTLSLYFVGCQKDSNSKNNPTNGSYAFSINLEGKSHSWTGGIPSPSETGQCAYVPSTTATLSMAIGTQPNLQFAFVGMIPLGIGSYKIDKNSNPAEKGIGGNITSQNEIFTIGDNNIVTITIDKIANNKNGEVSGTIVGSITIINTKTISSRDANINGSFRACKMN